MSNMDCEKLRADITKLKEARDSLRSGLDVMNETMRDRTEFKGSQVEAEKMEDQLLGDYLDTFVEKNPELTSWKLGDRITGFKDKDGDEVSVYAISPMPDGDMLVGGDFGAFYEMKKPEPTIDILKENLEQIIDKREEV